MSPGLTARPLGRFSVAPTTPTTRTGRRSRAIAPTASTTAAPPDMSNFISAILAPGFSEMPPLSNVTALPTRPSSGPLRGLSVPAHPVIAQHDQRRLLLGALRDRRERAHAARDDPLASLRLHGEPLDLLCQRLRVRRQRGRGEVVGGRFCRSRAALTAAATVAASATSRSSSAASARRRRARSAPAGAWGRRPPRPVGPSGGGRSGSRPAPCPPRAPRTPPDRAPLGACQHSVRVESSSARRVRARRGHAGALGREVLCLPSPTSSHRLPSAWATASALGVAAPRPRRSAPPPRRAARRGLLALKDPDRHRVCAGAPAGFVVCRDIHVPARYHSLSIASILGVPRPHLIPT